VDWRTRMDFTRSGSGSTIFTDASLQILDPDQTVSTLLTAFGAILFLIVVVAVLLKLLAISRLLTALILLGSLGLGGRFLILNDSFR